MNDDFVSGIEHHFDPQFFDRKCRNWGWFLRRLVKKSSIENRENAEQIRDKQVLYLSNHLSHYDYLIQMYTLWSLALPIPRIAARENVFTPSLGKLWKKCGAFRLPFEAINREKARNLKAHIKEIVDSGASIMVYPEGGRSYDGRLKPLHLGIIKYVFESAAKKGIPMLVAPQHIAYSSVIEAPYFDEIRKHKELRNLKAYLKTDFRAFRHRFMQNLSPFASNSVTHTFGEPFPLHECTHPREVAERARASILEMHETYQTEKQIARERLRTRQDSRAPSLRKALRYLESYLG